jgi:heptose-I-phosphate ethanolaminephosphotransferase
MVTLSVLIIFLFVSFKSKQANKTNHRLLKPFVNVVIIGSLSIAIFSSLQSIKELQKVTALDTLIYSINQKADTHKDIKRLNLSASLINPIQSNQTDAIETLVVIIGESYSKYHSDLYEYYLNTNPNLKKLKDDGNLFIYTDVVSPWNLTSEVFKLILSFKSQDDSLYWADTPLFPAIFKKSGWGSFFISNQIVKKKGTQWDFQMRSYLNNEDVENHSFHGRNDELHQYDLDLIRDYESLSDKLLPQNLIIFHLMGQHVKYTERYPPTFNYFTADSIKREDLNISHKQEIAEFDNATRYNDYVVNEIIKKFEDKNAIAIYLSDHGEEANDYRIQMDRTMEPVIFPNMARYQFEIPFMIWTSDTFKKKHPELTDKIKNSVNRPYLTDDLPHLLMDLTGVQSKWFDPSRSLINDKFNVNRKRLLRNGEDYDEIMKLPELQN